MNNNYVVSGDITVNKIVLVALKMGFSVFIGMFLLLFTVVNFTTGIQAVNFPKKMNKYFICYKLE